jgi:hypothetical protein
MNTTREYVNEFKQLYKDNIEQYNCNAILFYNAGTVDAYVNGQLLPAATASSAAGTLAINGLPGEVDKTRYNLTFATPGTGCLVYTTCKRYL